MGAKIQLFLEYTNNNNIKCVKYGYFVLCYALFLSDL